MVDGPMTAKSRKELGTVAMDMAHAVRCEQGPSKQSRETCKVHLVICTGSFSYLISTYMVCSRAFFRPFRDLFAVTRSALHINSEDVQRERIL